MRDRVRVLHRFAYHMELRTIAVIDGLDVVLGLIHVAHPELVVACGYSRWQG